VAHRDHATPVPYLVAYRWDNMGRIGTDWDSTRPRFVLVGGVAYGARTRNLWSHNPVPIVRGERNIGALVAYPVAYRYLVFDAEYQRGPA
jgi:hypothetical protein